MVTERLLYYYVFCLVYIFNRNFIEEKREEKNETSNKCWLGFTDVMTFIPKIGFLLILFFHVMQDNRGNYFDIAPATNSLTIEVVIDVLADVYILHIYCSLYIFYSVFDDAYDGDDGMHAYNNNVFIVKTTNWRSAPESRQNRKNIVKILIKIPIFSCLKKIL